MRRQAAERAQPRRALPGRSSASPHDFVLFLHLESSPALLQSVPPKTFSFPYFEGSFQPFIRSSYFPGRSRKSPPPLPGFCALSPQPTFLCPPSCFFTPAPSLPAVAFSTTGGADSARRARAKPRVPAGPRVHPPRVPGPGGSPCGHAENFPFFFFF